MGCQAWYLWDIYGIFMGFPTMICLGIHGYPIFRHILRSRPASDAHQRIAVRVRAEPFGHLIFCRIFKKPMSRTQGLWNSWNYMIIMISIIYKHIYIYDFIYDYIYDIYDIYGSFHKWGYPQWMMIMIYMSCWPIKATCFKTGPSRARLVQPSEVSWSLDFQIFLAADPIPPWKFKKEHARWCPIVS